MTIPFHSTLLASRFPFLTQREMYFDNISHVNSFLLLKHFGPISFIETAENIPIDFLLAYRTILGLGSASPRRTKSICTHLSYLFLKHPHGKGTCIITPFFQEASLELDSFHFRFYNLFFGKVFRVGTMM